jgi:hypothetical protein
VKSDLFAVEMLLTRTLTNQAANVQLHVSSKIEILVSLLTNEIPVPRIIHHRATYAIPTSIDTMPDPRDEQNRQDPQHLPKPTEMRSKLWKGVPHSPHGTWGGVSLVNYRQGCRVPRGCMQRVLEPFMFRMEVVPQSTSSSAQRSVVRR